MSFFGRLRKAGINAAGNSVQISGLNTNIGRGKTFYVDGANGAATGVATSPDTALNSILLAEAKLTTGRGDKIELLASTSSVAVATAMDWNTNLNHLMGGGSFGRMNMRSRIEQTAAFTPFFLVSGYGNSFQDLYFMCGTASATNVTGLSVTGQRNSFINCHVLPQDATAMDQAAFRLVSIDQSENYFKGCVIGGDGALWTNGAAVKLGVSGDGGPPRVIFEDCIFLMRADNAQVRFIDASLAGLGEGAGIFLNCQFINIGTALDYGINGAGLSNFKLYFDSRCSFMGVTDIVEVTYEAYVLCGGVNLAVNQVNTTSSKLFNMLATNPDVS
jgi:hypothetical protein